MKYSCYFFKRKIKGGKNIRKKERVLKKKDREGVNLLHSEKMAE